LANRLIAERMIGQIEDYEGKRYRDVVYRCIYCDFGIGVTSFESDEFRQNVYKGVVMPLRRDIERFCQVTGFGWSSARDYSRTPNNRLLNATPGSESRCAPIMITHRSLFHIAGLGV
jgi:hypothetical protein